MEACLYDVVRRPGLKPLRATPVESRKYTAKGFLYANQREADETPEEYRLRVRAEIAERPERYLARGELVRLESEERESAFDTWQTARLLREAELAGFAPKNSDSCQAFGGCPYLPVCRGSPRSTMNISTERRRSRMKNSRPRDLAGSSFGRWTVGPRVTAPGRAKYLCACSCGSSRVVLAQALRAGDSNSCGCLKREVAARLCRSREIHGHSRRRAWTATYRAWVNMLARVVSDLPSNRPYYKDRGVGVCERWRSFEAFSLTWESAPMG